VEHRFQPVDREELRETIEGMSAGLLQKIVSAPRRIGGDQRDEQVSGGAQHAGGLAEHRRGIGGKTQGCDDQHTAEGTVRKGQGFSPSLCHADSPLRGQAKGAHGGIEAVFDVEGFGEPAGAHADFQGGALVLTPEPAESLFLVSEDQPALRGVEPGVVSLRARVKGL